jgi:gamma-glutamyltranspeptidase/glutathione hydrolase
VVAPQACGLGGDAFVLVREPDGSVIAVNGAGAAGRDAPRAEPTGGLSVTVPGMVDLWCLLSERAGRLGLAAALEPANELALNGLRLDRSLAAARDAQAARLMAGGAASWSLMQLDAGDTFVQPVLAEALLAIANNGRAGFYAGSIGAAMLRAVAAQDGALGEADLALPAAAFLEPLSFPFAGMTVHVQPPLSQGVLLAMALKAWANGGFASGLALDHLAVELTQAAFAHRDRVGRGAALLDEPLVVDPERAAGRGGPRSYLHTAGVAVADGEGRVGLLSGQRL